MILRRILPAVVSVTALACPVQAQVAAPTYRDTAGQIQGAQGVIPLGLDGTPGALARAASTTVAGTIATANAYQSALAANATRKGCAVYNTSSATLLAYLGAPAAATPATSIPIPAGGAFNCGSFQGLVVTDQIAVTSATVGASFVVVSQ